MTKGSIRNPEKYLKAALRRRTERFDHCFRRGITLGDIDSFVEVNSHFLFLEWKVDDQTLSRGQWLALIRLSRQPKTSVWILWTTEDGFITHGQRLGTTVRACRRMRTSSPSASSRGASRLNQVTSSKRRWEVSHDRAP